MAWTSKAPISALLLCNLNIVWFFLSGLIGSIICGSFAPFINQRYNFRFCYQRLLLT